MLIILLSCSISSGALGSPDPLLAYSMIALALHNTIILILPLNLPDLLTPKSTFTGATLRLRLPPPAGRGQHLGTFNPSVRLQHALYGISPWFGRFWARRAHARGGFKILGE